MVIGHFCLIKGVDCKAGEQNSLVLNNSAHGDSSNKLITNGYNHIFKLSSKKQSSLEDRQ